MNISITRLITVIVAVILILAGVYFLVQAIPAKDWLEALLAFVAVVLGVALLRGQPINVNI